MVSRLPAGHAQVARRLRATQYNECRQIAGYNHRMSAQSPSYPAPSPHGAITDIGDDLYLVRGSIQMSALLRITRNMAIVREGESLTLINPIRLDAAGEKALLELGTVKHILRLGAFHGLDDPYYVDRFKAILWCQPGGKAYRTLRIDEALSEGCELPFSGAEFLPFNGVKQPEGALVIHRGNGLLLTCDAIQHYGDYRYNNLLARIVMPFMGFPRTTIVGPIWLKHVTSDRDALRASYERLLTTEFDSLLSAHGSFLERGAKANVRAAVDRAWSK